MALDKDNVCIKAEEIGMLKQSVADRKEVLDRVEKDVKDILIAVNNGINSALASVAKAVEINARDIRILMDEKAIRDYNYANRAQKERKTDIKNMPLWKKVSVIISGITLILSFSYTLGTFFTWVGNFLQGVSK